MPRKALTESQLLFCQLFIENGGNATDAYRQSFPKAANSPNASAIAARLKRNPLVQEQLAQARAVSLAAIESATERYQITAERVADELACLAFTRIGQVADVRTEIRSAGKRRQVVHVKDFADVAEDALAASLRSSVPPAARSRSSWRTSGRR